MAARVAIGAEPVSVSGEHQVLFGGMPQEVRLRIENRSDANEQQSLQYRLFQLAHRLYAPLGPGVRWIEVDLPATAVRSQALQLDLPSVRAKTRFKLAIFGNNETRLGTVDLTVLPKDLLEPLKQLAGRNLIGLWDPEDHLRPALDKLEIQPVNLSTRWNVEDFAGDFIISVHGKKDRDRLDEKNASFAVLKRRGKSVLCLLADPRKDAPLPLIAAGSDRDGNLVYAALSEVAALETAAAQLRLSQFLEFTRSREPLSLLNQYED